MICAVYEREPEFPASDQHPDAKRYVIGRWVVDATGGCPTDQEVDATVHPPKAASGDRLAELEAQLASLRSALVAAAQHGG